MAYAGYTFNAVQFQAESTPGTAADANEIWRGATAMLEDNRTRVIVEEELGLLVSEERSYDAAYLGGLTLPATPMTYEQVVHVLEASIDTATPSTSSPYVRTYTVPVSTTLNTVRTYTIETFNQQETDDSYEMEYSFVESFGLSAGQDEAWQLTSTWMGRQLTQSTPTTLSTLISVEEGLLRRTTLSIDATEGTIGTTQLSGVLVGASIDFNRGVMPIPVGDGNLYFSGIKYTRPSMTFSLTLELESDNGYVAAERVFYRSNTTRLFRLDIDGSDANRQLRIDWAGRYDGLSGYTNANGNTTVTLTGHAVYSSSDSLFAEFKLTNLLSAVSSA